MIIYKLDALKNQAKRPKKRYFYAQGVQNILSVCRDTVNKPGVHVDWKSIIAQYHEDNPDLDTNEESDDDSDTGSMDGLGKINNWYYILQS
jgi:hypothetical protein